METNAKVKMRGVQVGRVSQVGTAKDGARLNAGDRSRSDPVHPG